ncbi:hypothetical protein H9P43_007963 [Blastocladiella emersonii ATCC 22665]|nr:hypothetical protein H9P43_007963 [Blastocladiella emersonii ATCC 22665]
MDFSDFFDASAAAADETASSTAGSPPLAPAFAWPGASPPHGSAGGSGSGVGEFLLTGEAADPAAPEAVPDPSLSDRARHLAESVTRALQAIATHGTTAASVEGGELVEFRAASQSLARALIRTSAAAPLARTDTVAAEKTRLRTHIAHQTTLIASMRVKLAGWRSQLAAQSDTAHAVVDARGVGGQVPPGVGIGVGKLAATASLDDDGEAETSSSSDDEEDDRNPYAGSGALAGKGVSYADEGEDSDTGAVSALGGSELGSLIGSLRPDSDDGEESDAMETSSRLTDTAAPVGGDVGSDLGDLSSFVESERGTGGSSPYGGPAVVTAAAAAPARSSNLAHEAQLLAAIAGVSSSEDEDDEDDDDV